jgi:hypothetical protein
MPNDILIPIIIFLGSMIYATFGFGDALFAMPFLTMLIGIKTATPLMTLNGTTLAFLLFIKHRKDIDWKSAKRLVLSSFIGIPIGIYFLKNGNEQAIKIILGFIIISVAIYNLFLKKENVRLHYNWSYLFGFVAGILGGAFNTGGPPVAIFGSLSGWTQMQFVSTLQGYFLPSDLFILICQYASGLQTSLVWHYYIISLPFLLLALMIGGNIRKRIPAGKFNTYIFVLLLIVGIIFIVRSILFFYT